MTRIAINIDDVSSVANTLTEEKNNIISYNNQISTEVETIDSAWDGSDSLEYINKMQNDFNVLISDYAECLQSYIDFLSKVGDEYKAFDEGRGDIEF